MSTAHFILLKRGEKWSLSCSGKEFGPYDSWIGAARAAISHAKKSRGPARLLVEKPNGRCYPAREYVNRRFTDGRESARQSSFR